MRIQSFLVCACAVLAGACGGSGDGTAGPGPITQTLASITATPNPLSLAAGSTQTITVTGTDTQGNTIGTLSNVTFTSGNTDVALILSGGQVLGLVAGSTSITVNATHGSVTKTAAVPVTVSGTLPSSASVAGSDAGTFTPRTVAIARGGTVTWSFGAVQHNVVFAAGTGAPAGIPNTTPNSTASRTFSTAGTFQYDCTIHAGMQGTVVVR